MYDRTGTTSNALLSQWNENMNKLREYIANLLTKIANFIRPEVESNPFKELSNTVTKEGSVIEIKRREMSQKLREESVEELNEIAIALFVSEGHNRTESDYWNLDEYERNTYIMAVMELND